MAQVHHLVRLRELVPHRPSYRQINLSGHASCRRRHPLVPGCHRPTSVPQRRVRFPRRLASPTALNSPHSSHSCVFVPAYFSVLTCLFLFGMANEIRGPKAGLAAAAIMSAQPVTSRTRPVILTSVFRSVLPAHLMRSVAGGYDNESVAGTCAPPLHPLLRTPSSWLTPFPLSQLPPCPARSGCGCCPCAAASGSCSASHAPSCTSS